MLAEFRHSKSAKQPMSTVIIADGLTNAYLGEDAFFEALKTHVGARVRARLLGEGSESGTGPLCAFLSAAGSNKEVVTALITDRSEEGTADEKKVPPSLESFSGKAVAISADAGAIPAQALTELIGEAKDARILIVGTHTERRIFALAVFLKSVVGVKQVAVCSHLLGSSSQEAHLAAFRHNFLVAGVDVLLDLAEAIGFVGLPPGSVAGADKATPCSISPGEIRDAIAIDQRRIVELLCMHWNSAELRPLAGGFSGSLLFIAKGQKGSAKTEPVVLKIDAFSQMRRELDGYYRVKDFLGKNVPTFGFPVALGDQIGVAMELAAMEGSPETLQDNFESADSERVLDQFNRRFDKTLDLLVGKLYGNTRFSSFVVPYRQLGLHTQLQQEWLQGNAEYVLGYLKEAGAPDLNIDPEQLRNVLKVVAGNEDGLDSEACLVHGDLNLANVICDDGDNVWYIDWTHCGISPVELDFAKVENDLKFVMSKDFDVEDLPRLRKFEEFLLAHQIPPDVDELPDTLKFAKWDLRFRKILGAVRKLRQACFELKAGDEWLVYQIALLRYSLHTLSFDKRRDRGECDPTQLAYALCSVESLLYELIADDFHLKIRAAKPKSYPARQRIAIDEAHWLMECESYDPPYHVDPVVLENAKSKPGTRWADPEDFASVEEREELKAVRFKTDEGIPRNPRGRTGIAGRGLMGRWGANPAVSSLVFRPTADLLGLEMLAGRQSDDDQLRLPKGLVMLGEDELSAVSRVVREETGLDFGTPNESPVFDGYTYDKRQTDNAWVVLKSYLFFREGRDDGALTKGGRFEELKYHALTAEMVNSMASTHAKQVREAIPLLVGEGKLTQEQGDLLLAKTG